MTSRKLQANGTLPVEVPDFDWTLSFRHVCSLSQDSHRAVRFDSPAKDLRRMETGQMPANSVFPVSTRPLREAGEALPCLSAATPAESRANFPTPEQPGTSKAAEGRFTTAEALLSGLRQGKPASLPVESLALYLQVIDSEAPVREALAEAGRQMGFTVQSGSPPQARQMLPGWKCDVLLLEVEPQPESLELLKKVRKHFPRVPIVVTTSIANLGTAADAMREGATDYLTKPFSLTELTTTLHAAAARRSIDVELRRVQQQLQTDVSLQGVVAVSPAMQKLMAIVARVAATSHPVLVLGESGTGKERIARMLHRAHRALGRDNGGSAEADDLHFLTVRCSEPDSMLESQIFGDVAQERVGASDEQRGLLTRKEGGTLYLHEVDRLPLHLQARLIRALQDRVVHPQGASGMLPLTVRVVAASSEDLPAMVARGAFRKDLYQRLNVIHLRVPTLRQRQEDLPMLTGMLLERCSEERGLRFELSAEAMQVLREYEWPGNVRELETAIQRACTMSTGPVIALIDLPTQLQNAAHDAAPAESVRYRPAAKLPVPSGHEIQSIAELERNAILNTLRKLGGDKLGTARLLGIGKTTLYRKLKEYGIGDVE